MVSEYQSIFPITPELAAVYAAFPAWLRDNSARPTEWVIQHDHTSQGFAAVTAHGKRRTNDSVYDLYRDIVTNEDSAAIVFDRALYEVGDIIGMVFQYDDSELDADVDEDDDEIIYAAPEVQYTDQNSVASLVYPKGSYYVMFADSLAGWIRSVQDSFEMFENIRKNYLQNPQDFELACDFVYLHPMGWVKTIPGEKNRGFTNWAPNDDLRLVPHFSTEQDDKRVEWELEYGEHAAPEYTERYLDTDLSVYNAPSPEAAYITLAARIEQKYHPNGVEKEQNTHD